MQFKDFCMIRLGGGIHSTVDAKITLTPNEVRAGRGFEHSWAMLSKTKRLEVGFDWQWSIKISKERNSENSELRRAMGNQITFSLSVSHLVLSASLWPVDCSPPGSSVHGILQTRILEYVAIAIPSFLIQRLNLGIQHCRQIHYWLSHPGSPMLLLSHPVMSDSLQHHGLQHCPSSLLVSRLTVSHCLPEYAQTHIHWISGAIQPSHPLSSHSPPAFKFSQH